MTEKEYFDLKREFLRWQFRAIYSAIAVVIVALGALMAYWSELAKKDVLFLIWVPIACWCHCCLLANSAAITIVQNIDKQLEETDEQ